MFWKEANYFISLRKIKVMIVFVIILAVFVVGLIVQRIFEFHLDINTETKRPILYYTKLITRDRVAIDL